MHFIVEVVQPSSATATWPFVLKAVPQTHMSPGSGTNEGEFGILIQSLGYGGEE